VAGQQVTTTQPQWRYVPLVSTLMMCSGLFMLLHGTSPQPVRPLNYSNACEGVAASRTPPFSTSAPPSAESLSPDDRGDAAKALAAALPQLTAEPDPFDELTVVDAYPWSPLRSDVFWLRRPPSGDSGATHQLGTGPVDTSFDADDDDDDGDDDTDTDTDDGDGLATQVTASARVSCELHTSSVLSRAEVHHPVSFTSDVESLGAPPQ
jgi:hypothetical protein